MLMTDPAFAIYLMRLEQGLITLHEFIRYTGVRPSPECIDAGFEAAMAEYKKLVETMFARSKDPNAVENFIKDHPLEGWDVPQFQFEIKHKPTVYVKIGDKEFEAADVWDFCDLFDGGDDYVVYSTTLAAELKKMDLVRQRMQGAYYPTDKFAEFSKTFQKEYRDFQKETSVS